MGTIVIIDVYAAPGPGAADGGAGRPEGELGRQLGEAVAVLHRADATFSTWRPDSPVSRLRRGEITDAHAPRRWPRSSSAAWSPAICPAGGSIRGPCPAALTRPDTLKAGRRSMRSPCSPPVAVAGEPGLDLIDTIEGYEALIINPDGSRRWTKRFPIAAAGAELSLEHRDQHLPHGDGHGDLAAGTEPGAEHWTACGRGVSRGRPGSGTGGRAWGCW